MILVDSRVLIDALQGKDPKLATLFASLPATICGITMAEVLHGARDKAHYSKLEDPGPVSFPSRGRYDLETNCKQPLSNEDKRRDSPISGCSPCHRGT